MLIEELQSKQIISVGSEKLVNNNIIKVNWKFTDICNYKCSYCFAVNNYDKNSRFFQSIEDLKIAIANISKLNREKINITLTGGEPTIHPNYISFLQSILENDGRITVHTISNLSRNASFYNELINRIDTVDRQRISFTASYHFEFANMKRFVENAKLLSNHGVKVSIWLLAHPKHLEEVKHLCSKLNSLRSHFLSFDIKLVRDGDQLDKGYTDKDLMWLKQYYLEEDQEDDIYVEFNDKKSNEDYFDKTPVNGNELIAYQLNRFKGMLCNAGIDMITIDQWGNITPAVCFRGNMGSFNKNIFEPNTEINFQQPVICPFDSCNCLADIQIPKLSVEKSNLMNEETIGKYKNVKKLKKLYLENEFESIINNFSDLDFAEAHYYLGKSFENIVDYQKSYEHLMKYINFMENDLVFYNDIYSIITLYKTFKSLLNNSIHLSDEKINTIKGKYNSLILANHRIHGSLLKYLFDNKDIDAILDFEQCNSIESYYFVGRAYKERKSSGKAINFLEKYIESVNTEGSEKTIFTSNNYVVSSYFHSAQLYYNEGKFDKASKYFRLCLSRSGNNHKAAKEYLIKINEEF